MALLTVSALAAPLAAAASAQPTRALEGTVRDGAGDAVQGARVQARGAAGVPRVTLSDAAGRFRIDGLAPGRYAVRAEHDSFAAAAATVDLPDTASASEAEAAIRVDLTLDVLAAESLTVTGVAARKELDVPTAAGSRTGLTARETPATLDVITAADARERGLRTAIEALSGVPAVVSANLPNTPGITAMRGFSGGAISLLYDGTRITTSTIVTRNYDTWSFDRIEVLKGPASVLFGEGALAGAVNLVPKRPDFSGRRSEMLVSFGSLETGRVAAGTTGPIAGGRAAYRADVVWNRTAGYVDDSGTDSLALDAALDVKLGRAATLSVAVDHFRDNLGAAYFGTPLVSRATARQPSDLVRDSRGWVLDEAMRDANYNLDAAIAEVRTTWVRTKVDWRLSPSWRLVNELYVYDRSGIWNDAEVYTFTPDTGLLARATVGIEHDHQFYGDRLALHADTRVAGRRNRLVAGVEANRNDFFNPRRFGTASPVDPYAPVRGTFPADTPENFPGAGNRVDFATTLNLASVFAEDALTIAPRVTVVGGVHYDRLAIDRRIDDLNTGVASTFGPTFNAVSWRGGVVVDLLPRTQLFGQFSSAGAPVATLLLISQANAAFRLTTGRSWEGGVKSTLAGGRVDATASLFTITQDDIVTRDPENVNLSVQGGTQASTGVELSVAADVTRGLRVDASAAFLDARFESLLEAGGISRAGNVPPTVPERTARLWASYRIRDTPLTIAGGVRHQGRLFANNANSTEIAGFTLLDAQATWRIGSGEITVRGRNLTDTLYADWIGASPNQVLLGAPRTVDVTWLVRF